jgi:hypothetical protein
VDPPPVRETFGGPALAPHWISPRSRPDHSWSLTERPGRLTLHATGSTLDRPGHTFIGRRQQHPDCRVTARLDPGAGRAGLSLRIDEAHHYDLEVAGGSVHVIARIGPVRQCMAERAVPPGPVELVIEIGTTGVLPPSVTSAEQAGPAGVGGNGPDMVRFRAGEILAELDGRYLSTEVATGFTGRVVGMYVTEGSAAVDWFEYEPLGGAT